MSSTPCRALLDWYRAHARQLPWRETTDPYHIWISEIMLQQTQVKTVLPRYESWFHLFPDIASLAAAEEDKVLKAWEGLGYYRRARLLHAAAQRIAQQHGGRFPEQFDDIVALPGIGHSTAGAIASFCFGNATPVLDGNVKRVLRRWHGIPEAPDKELWQLAQQAIDQSGQPADWNQSMMELGATHCSPRQPDCSACPVAQACVSAFQADQITTPKKSITIRNLHWQVRLHTDPERGIWLVQRPASGIWAGLWTPPIIELKTPPDSTPTHIHLLTHRRLHLYVAEVEHLPVGNGEWFPDLNAAALPTGIKRVMEKHRVQR